MNILKVFSVKKQKPTRKPSALLLEMEAVNANLEQIAALLAAQKPPVVTVNVAAQPDTSGFEPFEPFDNSGEDTTQ